MGDLDSRLTHVIALCELCRMALDHKADTDGDLMDLLAKALGDTIEFGPPPLEGEAQ